MAELSYCRTAVKQPRQRVSPTRVEPTPLTSQLFSSIQIPKAENTYGVSSEEVPQEEHQPSDHKQAHVYPQNPSAP